MEESTGELDKAKEVPNLGNNFGIKIELTTTLKDSRVMYEPPNVIIINGHAYIREDVIVKIVRDSFTSRSLSYGDNE